MKINAPREDLLDLAQRLRDVLDVLGTNFAPTDRLFAHGLCYAVNNVWIPRLRGNHTYLMADIAESVGIPGGLNFLGDYGNWQLRAAYARLLIAYIEETV